MDKEHFPNQSEDDSWLDEILGEAPLPDEPVVEEPTFAAADGFIPLDPDAVLSDDTLLAGERALPDTLDLDQIIAETMAETMAEESAAPVSQEAPFRDEEYRDAFGEGSDLEKLFDDIAAPEESPAQMEVIPVPKSKEPVKKPRAGRPRLKKGYGLFGIPHILSTFIWLAIVIAIGVSLGRMVWVCAADILAFGREEKQVTLTITQDDTLDTITNKLKSAGLIRYPQLFKMYAGLSHAEEKISVGTFRLNTIYDYHALVNAMKDTSGERVEIEVVIPEGYSCAQIFAELDKKGVCSVDELEEYAANGEIRDFWFLEGIERGTPYCLEGYLFPDTYKFYTNDSAGRVLGIFLTNFENQFTDRLRGMVDDLNDQLAAMMRSNGYGESFIEENRLTVREVIIIASLIEKETASPDESYTIASVIYNRLTNRKEYPFLNIDAALVYALGGKSDPLTAEDLELDSPYNTYKYQGLVPGPISNPGLDSIDAALFPEETSYHYYALDPSTNLHHFSKTYKEHTAFLDSIKKDD